MFRNLAALAVLSLAAACTPGDTFDFDGDVWQQRDSNIQGRMQGDLPEVGSFDKDVSYGYINDMDGWVDVELNTVGEFGWAMVYAGVMIDENGEATVDYAVGCTGPDEGFAEYDEPATEAEVEVELVEIDGEEMISVTIEAEFEGAGDVIGVATAPAGE